MVIRRPKLSFAASTSLPTRQPSPTKANFWQCVVQFNDLWISLGIGLIMIGFYLLSRPENHIFPLPPILEVIEAKTLDWRFRLRGVRAPGDQIVIVAVDEHTEDELGRWQSAGRHWLVELLDVLAAAQAKVIGFDLTLAEPDKGPVPNLIENIKTRLAGASPISQASLTYLDEVQHEGEPAAWRRNRRIVTPKSFSAWWM